MLETREVEFALFFCSSELYTF